MKQFEICNPDNVKPNNKPIDEMFIMGPSFNAQIGFFGPSFAGQALKEIKAAINDKRFIVLCTLNPANRNIKTILESESKLEKVIPDVTNIRVMTKNIYVLGINAGIFKEISSPSSSPNNSPAKPQALNRFQQF